MKGFPKIRGTVLEGPCNILFGGIYWGRPIHVWRLPYGSFQKFQSKGKDPKIM